MSEITFVRSNPFDELMRDAKLIGRERGLKDAECFLRFLGRAAAGEVKNKIYFLSKPDVAEAHDAFVEAMEITQPVFDHVEEDSIEIEELGFEGRLMRQLILQNGDPIVCYVASNEPLQGLRAN